MHNVNDVVAMLRFCKVDVSDPNSVVVTDLDDGTKIKMDGKPLLESLKSADVFSKTEKKTHTALAEIVSTSFNSPITVCFDKTDGTQRVLRGRLQKSEPLLGRSYYEDLDIPKSEHRLRLVDHRTLKWVVVGGTRYELKKK